MDRALAKVVFCIFIIVEYSLCAHEYEQFFHANKVAQSGEYMQAVSLYDSCNIEGFGIFFNKSCCLYKMGHFVPALAAAYKALRYAQGVQCTDAYNQIDTIVADAGYAYHKTTYDMFVRVVAPYISYIPILWLQFFWILLFFIACYVAYMYRGYVRILLLLTVMMVILSVAGILMVKQTMYMADRAIIKKSNVCMHAGPNDRYAQLCLISEGKELFCLDTKPDWVKVTDEQQNVGWVLSSALCLV